jgi:hypothetical protein
MPRPEPNAMDVLASYRRWKEDGEALKSRAQTLLVERFASLVQEAQQLQHDLWEDFGQAVKFPANPKFARKPKARGSARKARTVAPTASPGELRITVPPAPQTPPPAPAAQAVSTHSQAVPSHTQAVPRHAPAVREKSPRPATKRVRPKAQPDPELLRQKEIKKLERKRDQAELRLQQAQAEGNPARIQNAEDRLYEVSDELRLLRDPE